MDGPIIKQIDKRTDGQAGWWMGTQTKKTYTTEWILCGRVRILTVSERVVLLPEPWHTPQIAWCNYNITWSLEARPRK